MKRLLLLLGGLFLGAQLAYADHRESDFDLLGSTELTHARDADAIRVEGACPSPENRPARAVLLKARGGSAYVQKIGFRYRNGEIEDIPVNVELGPEQASRPIDLAGEGRCIDEVFIVGRSTDPRHPARIDFYGLRRWVSAPEPDDRDGRGRHGRDAWGPDGDRDHRDEDDDRDERHGRGAGDVVNLGATELLHRGDRDFVAFPRVCGVRAVRLEVERNAAELDRLTLKFAGGQVQDLPLRTRYVPGSATGWIDLPGATACVVGFQVVGRTIARGPTAAVRLVGLRGEVPPPPRALKPKLLGKTRLSSTRDKDEVAVPETCGVRAVQVVVKDVRAKIDRVTLFFVNGRTEVLEIGKRFKGASPVIDLKGRARCIVGFRVTGKAEAELGGILPREARVEVIGYTD